MIHVSIVSPRSPLWKTDKPPVVHLAVKAGLCITACHISDGMMIPVLYIVEKPLSCANCIKTVQKEAREIARCQKEKK